MTINDFLRRLEGVKGSGGNYMARCPAHADSSPSLSIGLGNDRRILLKCHAGCRAEDIVSAMGLTMKDLFDDGPENVFPSYGEQPKMDAWKEAEYIYPGGQYKKIKMRHADGKKHFFWLKWNGSAWEKCQGEQVNRLYYYDPLDSVVLLVEGEKDVDTIHQLGFSAVSLSNGASSKWVSEYGPTFSGKDVFIIQDNDKPGKAFAQRMAGELQKDARSVRVLDLTQAWPELPEKGDVSDLIAHHGPEKGLELLARLMSDTPIWAPEKDDGFLSLFRPLTDFKEEEATWLVPGWIPEGQITLIAADGGIGKTTLWINIMAALSAGKPCILDPPGITRAPARVAFCTTEDSIRKKLLKKLREAGANMGNIVAMDLSADKDGLLRKFKFGSPEMERFVKYFKPVACVYDPVQGFIPPELNMGSRNAMRDCMAPLITLGEDVGTTFLVICHTNKRKGAFGRDRIADSADLWDIARSVIMAGYTKDQGVRYLSNEKNNYTSLQETVLFSINDNGQLVPEGTTWKRDREFTQDAQQASTTPARENCKAFLIQTLLEATGGAMPTSDLEAAAGKAGYSHTAVKRSKAELKQEGRVEYFTTGGSKAGDRIWHIHLLDGPPEFEELSETEPTPFDASPSET